MPPKADKLSQTIESLQLFLSRKAQEREDLADISRQLAQLNKTLSHKRLTLQIVSDEPKLAQATFDLIHAQPELKDFFQLKFDDLPNTPQQAAPIEYASLRLRQHLRNSTGLQQYIELNPERGYTVGRSPEADITIDNQLYQGVSWNHAVVYSSIAEKTQWHVDDCQSTNGTFVNAKRVRDSQPLNSGDIITLACPQTGSKVAELVFTVRVDSDRGASGRHRETDKEYWNVVDCDLLMIVVDSRQGLSSRVKEFIHKLDLRYISQLYLLVDTPDPKQEPEVAKVADANLNTMEAWLKTLPDSQPWSVIPLYLQPWYSELGDIDPRQQKKQERLAKILGNVVKRQPENILAKRITVKVVKAAEPFEPLLFQQQQELSQKLAQEQQKLASLFQVNFKEVSKKAIAEANQAKDQFFKQVKLDIAQSKAALLDIYSKKSVVYQIQDFVDGLTPVITNKNGQKIIQLNNNSDCNDINLSLIKFCTDSLSKWATQEWHQISYGYCHGGLNNLRQKLANRINIVPGLLSESPFSKPEAINVTDNFAISFAGTNCEISYKQKSLGGYIMKQLRSQMMQVMMMLTLVLGFVGIKSSRNQMMQNLSGVFQQQPWLFGIFVCGIIFLLINAYNSENDSKLEEAGIKLKKDLANYYQSFSKNLLEKVIQDLTLSLELEDKKIADN
ncbi:MAG: FHA domain-containing protein [Cyanobacteria bacterium J06642_3]